jgi:peptidyl-prolyl cis-trans isomerase C
VRRPRPTLRTAWGTLPALIALLAFALPARAADPAGGAAGDAVVARVNGKPILRRDFDLAVQLRFQGRRAGVPLSELKAVRDKALEGLIDNELLYQEASRSRHPIAESEIDAEIVRLRAALPAPGDLDTLLQTYGTGEADFRAQVRRTLVVTRHVDWEIAGRIEVGDEEVRRYYDQNPAEMVRRERVRVSQILARVATESPVARAAAREKIEAILKELRGGREFADAARRFSEGAEAAQGGDLGWVVRGGGTPVIERAAFALDVGETSDIVETRVGFHLLKVTGRQPEGPVPIDEAREPIRARLAAREREQKIQKHLESLKEKAKIERLQPSAP